tara:strand:- start:623 stop:1009 length:387 start_codon:yes stop_codon:yes gene_type:complete
MSDNPQSFFNCILGGYRNLIISVSCGIAIYGFSRNFAKKKSREIMKKLSILIYMSAFFIILNTVLLLRRYLNLVSEEDKKKLPIYVNLDYWRIYEYIGWFLVLIVAGLIGLSLKDYGIALFKKMILSL